MAKKIAALAAISLLAFFRPAAAQVAISQLPAASSLGGTEVAPVVQSGVTVKAMISQIDAYIAGKTHTWGATQTFSVAPVFTDQSGTRSGLGLGTAATQNTGTSGANIPLLNGATTWSAAQTFSVAPVFTDQSGSRSALGLGTAATQNIGSSGANVPLLSGSNMWGGPQTLTTDTTMRASNSTTLFDYIEMKPTDFGVGAPELGIAKTAVANVWQIFIYDGVTNNGGILIADQWTQLSNPLTVSTLPSAATAGIGARSFVTDATACTFAGTVTGGGSTRCPVYSDGTSWRAG